MLLSKMRIITAQGLEVATYIEFWREPNFEMLEAFIRDRDLLRSKHIDVRLERCYDYNANKNDVWEIID